MFGRARALGLPLGLLATLLLAACGNPFMSDVEPPEVSLAGLGFGEPGLFEQQLRVDLRLRNPNDFELALDQVTFKLEVNDKPFARGRAREGLDLPALGVAVVPVTVTVPTNDLIDRIMELGGERRLDYRLTGEAELASLFFGRIPFHHEGKLALPKLPGFARPGS
jgi:LEA14-like dessication related protein